MSRGRFPDRADRMAPVDSEGRVAPPDEGTVIPPIFPLSTVADLEQELAMSDRAIERLGEAPFVDLDQLNAYRARLNRWRGRIAHQLDQMKEAAQ